MGKYCWLSLTAVLIVSARIAQGQVRIDPAAGLALTPATFAVLNPSIFGDNSPIVLGGNYGHRPDARTFLFSGSLGHVRFQFGRTFWPTPQYGAKTLMTSLDYARGLVSHPISPAIELVSGIQGSAGYGLTNDMHGGGLEGEVLGVLLATGAQLSGRGFRLTPYVSPAYYYARGALADADCSHTPYCADGFRFSFGVGARLDVLQRLTLETGVRKTQAADAISRQSFGVSYRLGNLDGGGLRYAGSFTVQWDNDLFARTSRFLDQDYTQGFHFAFNRKHSPPALARAVERLSGCEAVEGCAMRATVLAGQEIYTPQYFPEVVAEDRPFGGWLYGGMQSSAATRSDLTSLSVKIGVTGPPSLAQQLQVTFHEFFPSAVIPPGWDTQLQFEPGAIITAEKRAFSEVRAGPATLGLIRSGSASIGNILTDIEAGLTLRGGINDVHPWMLDKPHGIGVHASVGVRGDLVLRNIFLDGNTFRSSPRVTRIPFVRQKETAAGISFGAISLDYKMVVRGKEFSSGRKYAPYGILSLARRGQF